MNKKTLIIILVSIIVLLLCCISSGILLWAADHYGWWDTGEPVPIPIADDADMDTPDTEIPDTDTLDAETPGSDTSTDTNIEEMAIIAGSVSYPSEGIPPGLTVCAEDAYGGPDSYCTNDIFQDNQAMYGFSYEISIPAGSYYVYAYDSEGDTSYTAYYNEFVTCGLSVDCPSHEKIMVTVYAGDMVGDIDPGDWYDF